MKVGTRRTLWHRGEHHLILSQLCLCQGSLLPTKTWRFTNRYDVLEEWLWRSKLQISKNGKLIVLRSREGVRNFCLWLICWQIVAFPRSYHVYLSIQRGISAPFSKQSPDVIWWPVSISLNDRSNGKPQTREKQMLSAFKNNLSRFIFSSLTWPAHE